MPNKNYRKGRRKEYGITDKLKKEGWDIVQRSKGSHSPIDVFAINKKEKKILLIQSKRTIKEDMSFINDKEKGKIEEENKELNGNFEVEFRVM